MRRPVFLFAIALLLGVLVWNEYRGAEVPQIAGAVSRPRVPQEQPAVPERSATAKVAEDTEVLELKPRVKREPQERLAFKAQRWEPPPPPPPPPAPPPKPMAPPLPYKFAGKVHDGSGWKVFLARGENTYIVHAAMTLEGSYRVESIAPPLMTLTYLPLNQTQTLDIGPAAQ